MSMSSPLAVSITESLTFGPWQIVLLVVMVAIIGFWIWYRKKQV